MYGLGRRGVRRCHQRQDPITAAVTPMATRTQLCDDRPAIATSTPSDARTGMPQHTPSPTARSPANEPADERSVISEHLSELVQCR